jgi:hypothetical protein
MKSAELKKLIKPLIRECLTEIFAEIQLEKIVEGVIAEQMKARPRSSKSFSEEVLVEHKEPVRQEPTSEERKEMMMERLGISEQEWRTMYSDTAESDNPILSGDDSDKPELVSENVLRQSGLYKDYSKFVP